jgi:hypothetical protein
MSFWVGIGDDNAGPRRYFVNRTKMTQLHSGLQTVMQSYLDAEVTAPEAKALILDAVNQRLPGNGEVDDDWFFTVCWSFVGLPGTPLELSTEHRLALAAVFGKT